MATVIALQNALKIKDENLVIAALLTEYVLNTRELLAIKLLENCENNNNITRENQLKHLPINKILDALSKK